MASFSVDITDDDIYEESEEFKLTINPTLPRRVFRAAPYIATVSIVDDEEGKYLRCVLFSVKAILKGLCISC